MPGILSLNPLLRQGLLGTGLAMGGQGLAPYGIRHSGEGVKGQGYFGVIPNPRAGGYSTELSTEFDLGGKTVEAPLLVPTLTLQEITHLLGGERPTEGIYQKARDFAAQRINKGLSPFAGPNDLHYPLPR